MLSDKRRLLLAVYCWSICLEWVSLKSSFVSALSYYVELELMMNHRCTFVNINTLLKDLQLAMWLLNAYLGRPFGCQLGDALKNRKRDKSDQFQVCKFSFRNAESALPSNTCFAIEFPVTND